MSLRNSCIIKAKKDLKMQYQIPKGLFDIVPYGVEEWKLSHIWKFVETIILKIARDYDFKEIRTPIFERTELFVRGVGESSDIVKKEMYTFLDKADRSMTLRPEGTASVLRAFIENNLNDKSPIHKLFYIGPMFRYDRPQAGRYRQFHQFGIEVLGNLTFENDVEVIDMLLELCKRLGLKNLSLYINSIGDLASREAYKKALKDFLKPHFLNLSKDSQDRYEKNPLRILDSKEECDREILKDAPSILEFLNSDAKADFNDVCNYLKALKIPFEINDRLVRGLDYYSHTVFEVVSGKLGAQNTISGGGRYDFLLKSLGGPDLAGTGFAIGLERIIQTMLTQNIPIPDNSNPFILLIPMTEEAKKLAFTLTTELRHNEIPSEIYLNIKKIQRGLQVANDLKVSFSVLIGEDELKSQKVIIKDMQNRTQESINLNNCINHLKKLWEQHG